MNLLPYLNTYMMLYKDYDLLSVVILGMQLVLRRSKFGILVLLKVELLTS